MCLYSLTSQARTQRHVRRLKGNQSSWELSLLEVSRLLSHMRKSKNMCVLVRRLIQIMCHPPPSSFDWVNVRELIFGHHHQSSIINHYVVTIIISFYTIILKNPYCKGCCALHGMFYYIKVMASVFTSFSQDCLLPEPDRKKHIDVCKEISFEYIKLT